MSMLTEATRARLTEAGVSNADLGQIKGLMMRGATSWEAVNMTFSAGEKREAALEATLEWLFGPKTSTEPE